MQTYCGECRKLPSDCVCGTNTLTCSIISSTSPPFQTLENMKRKSEIIHRPNSSSVVTKQNFYSSKLNEQYKVLVSPTNAKKTFTTIADSTTPSLPNIIRKRPRLGKAQEPECLTISSDEEEDAKKSPDSLDIPELPRSTTCLEALANRHERMRDKYGNLIVSKKKASASSANTEVALMKATIEQKKQLKRPSLTVTVMKESVAVVTMAAGADSTLCEKKNLDYRFEIACRSIRVGSYKLHPSEDTSLPATFTKTGIYFTVPTVAGNDMVLIAIQYEDIASILAHFGNALPVIFIYTVPRCGETIRSKLQMLDESINYYDPCGGDETCKRITILPDGITEDERQNFRAIFPPHLIKEIGQVQANEILVRSVPVNPQVRLVGEKPLTRSQTAATTKVIVSTVPCRPVVKLLTYPPLPQTGGITITSEDLECLNPLEFLNDVIIDFYLKYLVTEKLSDNERQKIHVFNSFFYPCLTQKPTSRNSIEENSKLTAQQRRHGRVKTWTKNVDIFQKDFIIVPINQNAHWFLAIICYPSRDPSVKLGCEPNPAGGNKDDEAADSSPDLFSDSSESAVYTNGEAMETDAGNRSFQAMEVDVGDKSHKDDPESETTQKAASLVPYDSGEESSDGVSSSAVEESVSSMREDMSNSCILIFDSLPGPSRWRIVSTLREYLEVEWEAKKGSKRSFYREIMKGMSVRVPVQSNFSDCGVYLLQYVESFFETMFAWPKSELWFEDALIASKRDKIKELILELQKKYNGSSTSGGSDEISASSLSDNATSTKNTIREENS